MFVRQLMRVTSKAPCRVDLAGATLDIWPLYLFHERSVTVNFAVSLYTCCDITTHQNPRIILRSKDLEVEESFDSLARLQAAKRYRLPILARLIRYFEPESGFTMESASEAPAGAGISGSSSLMIATATALNKLTSRGHSLEKIREIAQNVEAQVIRVPTGSQDYYPAMYGGISAIELSPAGIVRKALPVEANELNQRLVLVYTGAPRNSGINNWEVMKGHIDGNRSIHRNFNRIASIANSMRDALEAHDWARAGRLMREEWTYRRKNIPGITTPLIDRLIATARRAGSTGAKVCGAGGGGCVVFLAGPDTRQKVTAALRAAGAQILDVQVAPRGVQIKTERVR
jgi:D-glycero-alpha-D-manno-heptose-7-phosphate kinase